MSLSVDEFNELMEMLGAALQTGRQHESRRARRLRHKADVAIIPCYADGHGDAVTVKMQDLSLRGIRFVHDEKLDSGQEFLMMLAREGRRVLCTVAHCTSIGEGRYSIGAEFVCTPDKDPITDRDAELDRIRKSILK